MRVDLNGVEVLNHVDSVNARTRLAHPHYVGDPDSGRHVKIMEEFVLAMAGLRGRSWLANDI